MEYTFSVETLSLPIMKFGFVFVRISAMMFFLPVLGESYVPTRTKLVVALGLTTLIFPLVQDDFGAISTDFGQTTRLVFTETLAGLFWGVLIRLLVHALQIAGTIMSQAISLAQIFGGTVDVDAQPAIGHILVISGVTLLCIVGLHKVLLVYIIQTYELSPPGQLIPANLITSHGTQAIARAFALAFQISAAVLIATLFYNFILGVINRAMPQLLVSFVGAPAITAGGLLIMALISPFILDVWLDYVSDFINNPTHR